MISSYANCSLPVVPAFQIITAASNTDVVHDSVLVVVILLLACVLVILVVAVVVVFTNAKPMFDVVGLLVALPACRLVRFVIIVSYPNLAFDIENRLCHEVAPRMLNYATDLILAHLVRPV